MPARFHIQVALAPHESAPMATLTTIRASVVGAVAEPQAVALGTCTRIAVPAHQRLDVEDVLGRGIRVEEVVTREFELVVVTQLGQPDVPRSARRAPAAQPARCARRASIGSSGTRRCGTLRGSARSSSAKSPSRHACSGTPAWVDSLARRSRWHHLPHRPSQARRRDPALGSASALPMWVDPGGSQCHLRCHCKARETLSAGAVTKPARGPWTTG
jgi:hypothetical protein